MSNSNRHPFPPPAVTELPIAGREQRFPVRRIFCVGRNYLAHIRELDHDEKQPPIFFMKPAECIVQDGGEVPYATLTHNFHYELELAVALHSGHYNIPVDEALSHIFGYAIALDMTKRDIQKGLTEHAQPWEVAKAFDHSCPCGPVYPVLQTGHLQSGRICLRVNGEVKQDSDISLLIWDVPHIIAELSRHFELKPGDLILTGTPHGVGPVSPGDHLEGQITGLGSLNIRIGEPAA